MVRFGKIAFMVGMFGLASCGEVATFSQPISFKVGKVGDGDVQNETFDFDKDASTEAGDPYKAFIDAARVELEGRDPSAFEVSRIVMVVGSDSKGVGTGGFAEVMTAVEVYITKSETTVVVGRLDTVPSGTTVEVPISGDREALQVMHRHLLKGDFKVGVRGDARADRPSKFELRTNVQVEFVAIE
jgi:hypothetical protein